VELPGQSLTGTATDVTDAGHLEVQTEDGLRTFSAADVVHLRRSPPET
jgi:biotin-(acetyl-CoA carboxylase) ligase